MGVIKNMHAKRGAQRNDMRQAKITSQNVQILNLLNSHKQICSVVVTNAEDAKINSCTVIDGHYSHRTGHRGLYDLLVSPALVFFFVSV